MRYAVIVMVDTEESPDALLTAFVSCLKFEAADVRSVVVVTEDGDEVAAYDRKEEEK